MGCCNNQSNVVQQIIHGASGITQAVLGIDAVSSEVRNVRITACKSCEHSSKHSTKVDAEGRPLIRFCDVCHCLLHLKVRNRLEECPLSKW